MMSNVDWRALSSSNPLWHYQHDLDLTLFLPRRPIKLLRWYSILFFQVLEVASMTLFLMTLDCNVSSMG